MQFDPQLVERQSIYKLLIGCVVPRPIAWVSSISEEAIANVAPFSFFMAVCNDPPTLAFSSGRREGSKKDTVRNIEYTQDFVVNMVDDALAEQMNLTSGEYPPDIDEFALTGLTAAPGVKVKAPRVAEAPISMECRVVQILPVGHGPIAWCSARLSIFTSATISITPTLAALTCTSSTPLDASPATSTRMCMTSLR